MANVAGILPLAEAEREQRRLQSISVGDFLALEIPPREMVLGPIIPEQGICMLYSKRGIGKTHVGSGIAYAVATGGKFLRWEAPTPRPVLYIDGEMPAVSMQERLAHLVASSDTEPPSPDYLKLITPDLQDRGMPDLSSPEGQEDIEPHLEGRSLVIVDNLSALCRFGRENESESWTPVQTWALGLRRRGISVLLMHHAGKSGQQRGTSRREDVLDVVVNLRHPSDYTPEQGARFEVHIEKGRHIIGEVAKPFEAWLEVCDNAAMWTTRDIEDVNLLRVVELLKDGLTERDIQDETGLSKGKIHRLKKTAKEANLL